MDRKLMTIIGLVSALSLGAIASLVSPSEADSLNADCTPKGMESEIIAQDTHAGSTYKLVISSRKGADGWIYQQRSLVVADGAGCRALLNDEHLKDALPTSSMVTAFTEAYWRSRTNTPLKKKGLEEFLHNTPVAVATEDSYTVVTEDIEAFKTLGIRYPKYLRGMDTFDSYAEAEAYYEAIFTDEWYRKNQPEGDH